MSGTPTSKLGPRPARGAPEETARRLLLAAAEELNERGYYATDTNRIAERAGYSPGTFYKHSSRGRRAEAATLLFMLERTADAIAEGETEALGVPAAALVAEVAERLARFSSGERRERANPPRRRRAAARRPRG